MTRKQKQEIITVTNVGKNLLPQNFANFYCLEFLQELLFIDKLYQTQHLVFDLISRGL